MEVKNITAIKTIKTVEHGDIFIVKDLFLDIDWRHIALVKRRRLGVEILKYSETIGSHVIRKISGKAAKTKKGQQRYRKL